MPADRRRETARRRLDRQLAAHRTSSVSVIDLAGRAAERPAVPAEVGSAAMPWSASASSSVHGVVEHRAVDRVRRAVVVGVVERELVRRRPSNANRPFRTRPTHGAIGYEPHPIAGARAVPQQRLPSDVDLRDPPAPAEIDRHRHVPRAVPRGPRAPDPSPRFVAVTFTIPQSLWLRNAGVADIWHPACGATVSRRRSRRPPNHIDTRSTEISATMIGPSPRFVYQVRPVAELDVGVQRPSAR